LLVGADLGASIRTLGKTVECDTGGSVSLDRSPKLRAEGNEFQN